MPFGLPPVWPQALKQPFPNRNFSFLLFLFLPAMAIQGFFFAHFLPKTGLPVWGSYSFERVAFLDRMILLLSPGLRSWYAGSLGALGRLVVHYYTWLIYLPLVSHSPAWFYTCLPFVSDVYFMLTVHMEYALPAVNFPKKTFHQNLQQLFLELQITKHIQKW